MKICASIMMVVMAMSSTIAFAAPQMGQHTDTDNVYIEGNLTGTTFAGVNSVTIKLYDKSNSELKYFTEAAVDSDRSYKAKFKLNEDASSLGIDVRYNGENLNDTLEVAQVSGKGEMVEAKIVLLNERNSALSLDNYESEGMPTHDYGNYKDSNGNVKTHSYRSSESLTNAAEAKAMIYINNKYADNATYLGLIAFYDNNAKLINVTYMDERTVEFDTYSKEPFISENISIPEGALNVKGFVWENLYSMIPLSNTKTDKLDVVSLYVIGDSTYGCVLDDYSGNSFPRAGVGAYLPDYFNTDYVNVINRSVSGMTTSSFLAENAQGNSNWLTVKNGMKKGDYLLITLGINDYPNKDIYKNNLDEMIKCAQEMGVNVIIGTAVGIWSTGGDKISESGVSAWEKPIFEELKKKYPFVDILDISGAMAAKAVLDTDIIADGTLTQGEVQTRICRKYHLDSNYFTEDWGLTAEEIIANSGYNKETGKVQDSLHLNAYGANQYAKLIAELLADTSIELKHYLR